MRFLQFLAPVSPIRSSPQTGLRKVMVTAISAVHLRTGSRDNNSLWTLIQVRKGACENKFCPVGTFCDIREITSCVKPPCRPIAMCLPDSINGCKGHPKCPAGEVCVEHRTSCINRSCKKEAKCAREGS
uniref:Follistatin-like domain-containing protein n=1 Tax=Parascaris equorum TaxID=6256 RepID=A0A914RW24_PAREQ